MKRNKNQFMSDMVFNQHYDSIQESINNSLNIREFNSGRTSPKKSHSHMSQYKSQSKGNFMVVGSTSRRKLTQTNTRNTSNEEARKITDVSEEVNDQVVYIGGLKES